MRNSHINNIAYLKLSSLYIAAQGYTKYLVTIDTPYPTTYKLEHLTLYLFCGDFGITCYVIKKRKKS